MTPRPVLLLLLVVGALVGCGSDEADTTAPRPSDLDEVRALFADDLADLGLRLTDRGGVVDADGGYTLSSTGRHLSLYVEPVDDHTTEQYVDGILDTARVLGPEIFARWSAIESFDVCQEPPEAVDDAEAPLPYTRLDVHRDEAASIDWEDLTLPDFLALASARSDEGVDLFVEPVIRSSDPFQAALAEAGLSP